jgi:hypothetical protein
MRRLSLMIALFALSGCNHDVALRNPVTGEVATCRAGTLADINPWSQVDMCVEEHVSEGWTRE